MRAEGRVKLSSAQRVLCASLILLVCAGASAATTSRRDRAALAWQKALRLRVALETHSNPSMADYLRVIRSFQLVYRIDPGYTKTPAALAASAEVYEEMGRQFSNDRCYSRAVGAYRFLSAQYPYSSLARDALFTIAEIYRTEIENPEEARTAYQQFLAAYPRSRQSAIAQKRIADISRQLARWSSAHASEAQEEFADAGASGQRQNPDRLQDVEAIRDWAGPNYTRVVIRVGGKVKFNAMHLQNPPRLVFDLSNTRLSGELARKVFPVENGFLQRIRVAQFKPRVTRIVLDVPQIEDYSVFSLPNPFRLIIDIHGEQNVQLARASRAGKASEMPPSGLQRRSQFSAKRVAQSNAASKTLASALSLPLETEEAWPGQKSAPHATQGDVVNTPARALPVPSTPRGTALASPSSAAAASSPTLTRALGLKIRRIVIDPGHGGHDTGTIGPSGLEEKNVVLDVGLRLRKLIERRMGCQVIMTRSTDTFIPLEERTAIANEYGADLFISIHANASRDPAARGIETYFLNFTSDPEALALAARENATSRDSVYQLQNLIKKIALSEKIDESDEFAKIVDRQLVLHLDEDGYPQPNRGVKKAPFVVLIGANMPSILAEISFLSNPRDERFLRKASYREKIAVALYAGVARYARTLGTLRVAQDSTASTARPAAQPTAQEDQPSF
ncbi:MAG: N-acetylmuramoyl-L-alanine amidase [Terriglobia bacterium]